MYKALHHLSDATKPLLNRSRLYWFRVLCLIALIASLLAGEDGFMLSGILSTFLSPSIFLLASRCASWTLPNLLLKLAIFLRSHTPKQLIPLARITLFTGVLRRQKLPAPMPSVKHRRLVTITIAPKLLPTPWNNLLSD